MSNLHRLVQAGLDAHTPGPQPSFGVILERKRRRDRLRGSAALAVTAFAVAGVALVAGLSGSGGDSAPAQVAARPVPADAFVAQYGHGAGDTGGGNGTYLSVFDGRSGEHVRDLLHFDDGPQPHLAGFSRSADGDVLYAAGRGPRYRSGVMNGDPAPGSCGGQVHRIDAKTGRDILLLSVGEDWTVRQPVLSSDGKTLAYLTQPCTDAFAEVVALRDLSSGEERRISVPRTSAGSVRWSTSGESLVFTVIYPEQSSASDVPGYVVVPADAEGVQPATAVRRAPDPGCVVQSAVFSPAGLQLIEGCPNTVTGPARLVQLTQDGAVTWREDTGLCPNGLTAAYGPQGRLLVTGTTSCGGAAAQVDVVQAWEGRERHEIARYGNPQQFVSAAS